MNKEEYLKITERFLDSLEAKALQSDTYFIERNKLYTENQELKEEIKRCEKANIILDEECVELKDRIDKAVEKIQLLIDIGFDYDGFNKADSLKTLIDELVNFARDSRAILKGGKE